MKTKPDYDQSVRKLVLLVTWMLFTGPLFLLANEHAYRILSFVDGVKQPVISLNGSWQFRFAPSGKFDAVQVPGELAMQGYAIEHDKPYMYLKTFSIPADYAGKRVILRFDGVYSYARLTINGKFVREHHGGFTRWETDVTDFVNIGKKNELQVEITDRIDDISYGSGYAHHPIGGILRDVTLFALPPVHLRDFYVETQMDAQYRDAQLKIAYSAVGDGKETEVVYSLMDDKGTVKATHTSVIRQGGDGIDMMDVKSPMKWDAEHPNLYTLSVSMMRNGKPIGQFNCKTGFRDIKIVGDRMLVNGQPVKLRGACRHDVHAVLGRATTADIDSLDALLFREANMNFVRTSHYPPSERFLEYCDRYGLYVECETAVCFVNFYRSKNYEPSATHDDPAFTERYLSQCREMVKSFRSHPSILIWSIGNESNYGVNFQQCYDWIKTTDATRYVNFSWPGTVPEGKKTYDNLIMHYPFVDGSLTQENRSTVRFQGYGVPALFDEWAHTACYDYRILQVDPNIREFWGITLDKLWINSFEAPGCLGGAIWCYADDNFMLPAPKVGIAWWKEFARTDKPDDLLGNCVGYGEWGIVDIWRRKKPEFWSTKKAYSPVRLLQEQVSDYTSGQRIMLPVYNRFDHTRLDEIKAYTVCKGIRKEIKLPPLEPHRKGIIEIEGDHRWASGDKLAIEFLTADSRLIDAYHITLGQENIELPQPSYQGALHIEETDDRVTVKGTGFEIPFCKETGLICNARAGGKTLITKGPFLNMDVHRNWNAWVSVGTKASSDSDWKKTAFACRQKDDHVWVSIAGVYGSIRMDIQIDIAPEGKITFDYTTDGEPNGYVRESGLKFYLSDDIEHLQWKRKGYWSYYPANDFAGNEGETPFYSNQQALYGKHPTQEWQHDTHNYYYWADAGAGSSRPLTQMAKGTKENIYAYMLTTKDKQGLAVVSADASVACRIDRLTCEQLVLYANNRWDYPEIGYNNYCKIIENTPCFGRITLMFDPLPVLFTNPSSSTSENEQKELSFLYKSGDDGYDTYRIPAMVVTNKGTVLAFAEGRVNSWDDSGNIDMVLKRSVDGGKTWSKLQVVWDDGENVCGNPAPVVDSETGNIFLLMTHNLGSDTSDEIINQTSKGTRRVFVTQSADDGVTWTKPVEITKDVKPDNWTWYATGPCHGIQLVHGKYKGRLVIPCSNCEAETEKGFSHIIYSDDHGKTWKLGGRTPVDQVDESTVAEISDGKLLLNMRTYNYAQKNRRTAISNDGGITWVDFKVDNNLIDPICQGAMLRYSFGSERENRLLFTNPANVEERYNTIFTEDERCNMTLRLSNDDGASWAKTMLLYAGPAAYSDVVKLPDGDIGCFYEAGYKHPYEGIVFEKIRITDIEKQPLGLSKQ